MDAIQLDAWQQSTLAMGSSEVPESCAQQDVVGSSKRQVGGETSNANPKAPVPSDTQNEDKSCLNVVTTIGSNVDGGHMQLALPTSDEPRDESHVLEALRHEFRDICAVLML